MVLKRPTTTPANEPAPTAELMEHLVKKSLDINPNLRGGKDTREVLEDLKREAVARAKQGGASEAAPTGAAAPRANLAERRKSTMVFFFEQKAQEFDSAVADIDARERLIQRERKDLQERFSGDLVDFIALMAGGDSPELRDVLREFRAFLAKLGANDQEIIRQAKARR
jgi:hypothetical protein